MTKYGQKILKDNGIESTVIYHGVDTSLFKPISEENKKQLKVQIGLNPDLFVFGGVFKNMQRKNPEKYLQAFRILLDSKHLSKEEKDKMLLLLHTSPAPQGGGEFDLVQQATDYGLTVGKNVVFSAQGLPPEQMHMVFQTFDVFLHLGTMEGFGLPIIEAMSCGIPIIGVNSCTMPEIIEDCGLLSDVPTFDSKHKISFGSYNGVECDIANPWDIAQKMEKLYKEASLRKELCIKATERTVKTFDWRIIQKQWIDFVKTLVITESDIPAEWKQLYEETKV
jgi:glycosyltransferase involved in cell wall biosynthesis